MAARAIRPHTGLPQFDRALASLQSQINDKRAVLDLDRIFEDLALSTTETRVRHGLGYVPRGYVVVKRSAAQHIYDGTTAWTDTDLFLLADGAVTATVVVF
jgi:hypothetical protein